MSAGGIANVGGVQVFHFDAYGNAIGFDPATAATSILYSGEMFDVNTGLQYLRARYYNPATGTFNRLDPFTGNIHDPQSFHKYLYTHADPVNGIDPTGMFEGGLQGLVASASAFTANVGTRVGAVFAAGGATIGRFFNEIGARTYQYADVVLRGIPNAIITTQRYGTRIADFVVRVNNRTAIVEAKYRISTGSEAFNRMVLQIQAYQKYGNGSQIVLWTLRPPTLARLKALQLALGNDGFNKLQIVHGIEGLYHWVRLYFQSTPQI